MSKRRNNKGQTAPESEELHQRNDVPQGKPEEKKQSVKEQKKETPQQVQPQPAQEEQGGFSMIKYMCFAFIFLQLASAVYQMYFVFFPVEELHVEESTDKYINYLKNHQPFNISVFLLDQDKEIISELWREGPLHYNYSDYYPLSKTIELPVTEGMRNSKLVYLMATLTAPNFYYKIHRERPYPRKQKEASKPAGHVYEDDESEQEGAKWRKSRVVESRILNFTTAPLSLIQYEKAFEIVEKSLVDSDTGAESVVEVSNDTNLYPYLKSSLYLTLVHDTHGYVQGEFEAKQLGDYKREPFEMYYSPMLYVNDFWTLKRHLVRISNTTNTVNLTIGLNMISPGKVIMTRAMKMYEAYPGILEEVKEIFSDANVYLLTITMIVSLLHTVLDILSVKNDIQFWMTNKSFKGISVKSVFVQIGFDVILFLYVWDNNANTSNYILATMGVSILVDVWKVTRVCKFSFKPTYPFITFDYQKEYTKSKTDDYDSTAIKFMSYLLFPLFLAYSVYSFLYKPHKGYYSYVIGTLAGGVYTFGFILMTPQLYINYKMKSVTNMPWRALFYRFLNTIIDDLFSFVIKMPTLRRIACFRDDVIFVIYLYQRYKYPVDMSRTETAEETAAA